VQRHLLGGDEPHHQVHHPVRPAGGRARHPARARAGVDPRGGLHLDLPGVRVALVLRHAHQGRAAQGGAWARASGRRLIRQPRMAGPPKARVAMTVLVAALGYFVDIYDLVLFSIVRVESLLGIGIPSDRVLDAGVLLLNMQMGGMLVGGVIWGILGDRRGRLSVLFGSIAMYSVANVANGFVQRLPVYAALRLFAGIGLAGELGAGITLVSEVMGRETRGYGTALVAAVGILGAVVAALVGDFFPWRTAYFVGGGLGLGLLLLRVGLFESGLFEN